MTQKTRVYEGMFLLDNQVVRADWKTAKSVVTDLIKKHGGATLAARRWDERRLAYPIRGRKRGTYLLTYFEMDPSNLATVRRDLELDERVLRYLALRVESVPASELELSSAELAEGFTIPPPPSDEDVIPVPEETVETPEPAEAAADSADVAEAVTVGEEEQ